jgi:hypothetical protein
MNYLFHIALGKGPNMSIPHWRKDHEEDMVVNFAKSCLETGANF